MKKFFYLFVFLFFTASSAFTQVSKQQAVNSVLNSVVGDKVDAVNVYMDSVSRSDSYFIEKDFPPITQLEIDVAGNDTVSLNWNIPTETTEANLSWSNMAMSTSWGIAAAQCATDQAARFDIDDLTDFVGWKVKDVSLILSYTDTISGLQNQHYYMKIWKGTENELEEVYEKEIIHPEYTVPLTIVVDSVIEIEDNKELWIGYYIDQYMQYPWVTDNLQFIEKGFYYRLYHRNYQETDCIEDYNWYHNEGYIFGNLCVSATISSPNPLNTNKTKNVCLTGYRVYRDGILIKEIPYSFVTYFTDTEFTRETDVEYCVTAVYGEEESEPVCATATITGIGDTATNDGITLSPNPTNGLVLIEGATITDVRVYNTLGQLVKTTRNSNEINLKGLPQGIYTIHITNEDGNRVIRKVVKE